MLNARSILEDAGVQPGMRVAEFAPSRTGHFPFAASPIVGEEGAVFAVHLLQDVLHDIEGHARVRGLKNVWPIRGDFERIGGVGLEDGLLDMILLAHALPHLQDDAGFAGELERLLKPDGKIVVIDWHPEADHPLSPHSDHCAHPDNVEYVFAHHGIARERWIDPADTHWGAVFRIA